MPNLTKAEVEEIVEVAVTKTLGQLGFSVNDPGTLREHHLDMAFLREFRKLNDNLKVTALRTIMVVFITGIVASVVAYFNIDHKP